MSTTLSLSGTAPVTRIDDHLLSFVDSDMFKRYDGGGVGHGSSSQCSQPIDSLEDTAEESVGEDGEDSDPVDEEEEESNWSDVDEEVDEM